ncbi:hypothetical protein EON65_43850 [archaeon]|nr:MAG: hypothetical protein EON65_43850 [archaeon]
MATSSFSASSEVFRRFVRSPVPVGTGMSSASRPKCCWAKAIGVEKCSGRVRGQCCVCESRGSTKDVMYLE